MSVTVYTKSYTEPPIRRSEVLRYAGCAQADANTLDLLEACITEAGDKFVYKICYGVLSLTVHGSVCDLGVFSVDSLHLAKNLSGCCNAAVFAAAVGVGIDRLIAKYSRVAPSKALMMQALGAERIESLCDMFCADLSHEKQTSLRSRFSPGYGDLPLQTQRDIFTLLDCTKRIGITLNDSLLISPSKSVTGFIGIDNPGL